MITVAELKKYLSQLFYLSLRLNSEAEAVAQYRARAMKTTTTWQDTPNGGRAVSSPQAVWLERAIIAQDRLKHTAAELLQREQTAAELLQLLEEDRARAILEDYHLHRMNVQAIAAKYHYSERQIIRIKKKAYFKLTDEINKRPELIEKIQGVKK